MIKVVNWNIAKRHQPWRDLLAMDADVALLQEAGDPPSDVKVDAGPDAHWDSHLWNSDWYQRRGWSRMAERWAKIVRLSDRVAVEWFKQDGPCGRGAEDSFPVSAVGTIAAARVTPVDGSQGPFIVVSMYASWVKAHPTARSTWRVGMPDGQAHRIISDLSAFVGDFSPAKHRVLAAGDLNMDYGAWTKGGECKRERTVWDRFEALGFAYLGPQQPHGRAATPVPAHLPSDTKNVPTYHTNRMTPATAQLQLDHVFASKGFHEGITTRALNEVDEWGSSDHCRIVIEVGG